MASDWDVIVIGAGLGGLGAAAYLAANGRRTLLLEQADRVGGCSHVFRRRGRWEFDVGVHYIGDVHGNGAIGTVLRGLGLDSRIEFEQLDPDGFDTLVFPDRTFRVPADWDRYLARLIEAFPAEERGLRRCIKILRSVGQEAFAGSLPTTKLGYLRAAPRMRHTIVWGLRPLSALFDRCRLSAPARAVISAQFGDYGTPPGVAPVSLHGGLLEHYFRQGAFYPKGGGQVIAAHLADVVLANGGAVRTGVRVTSIDVEQGAVTGVHLADGQALHAPVVVSNADIKRTYLDLLGPAHVDTATRRRIDKYRMAMPLFSLYLGLDIDVRDRMPSTNYWTFESYADTDARYAALRAGTLPSDLPVFISSASVKDLDNPHVAPPGQSTIEVMTGVPAAPEFWGLSGDYASSHDYAHNPDYLATKHRIEELLVERLEQVLPGVREHIVWRESSTPMTQSRYTLSTAGSCYGIELARDQFGPFRPTPRTGIRGLYLAGASLVWGNGIVGALSSGLGAAGAVLGRDLRREIHAGAVFGDIAALSAGGPGWDPLAASRNLGRPRRRTTVS